mmetsp:Transcript_8626/g.22159  ORF Transcript_8626/g.22159 Transcript_8626/m.22159 type:complete len:310 (+) Transcript_8626:1149-2078(+)
MRSRPLSVGASRTHLRAHPLSRKGSEGTQDAFPTCALPQSGDEGISQHCRALSLRRLRDSGRHPNDGGLQLCVAPVGWDDCTAAGNLRAHILGVPALAGGDKGHLLRDHTLLGVVHLRAALGVLCTLGHPGGAKLGKLLARVDALRAAGVVEVDVATSAVEHHAAERDLERRAVVLQLLVHLDAVGEALLERRILDEVKLLRVLGPVDGLFLGLGQGLELLESVARLEANALTSLQLFQSIEISLLRGFHNRHRHATGGGRGGAAAGGPAGRGAQGAQRRAGDEAGGGGGGERRHFGCGRKVGSKHCFD